MHVCRRGVETRSFKYFALEKINIIYSEIMFVATGMQHVTRMGPVRLYRILQPYWQDFGKKIIECTRVGTLIVATIYLQLIQNRYTFRSFTVIQRSHQHCVQPVASDVEAVGYL